MSGTSGSETDQRKKQKKKRKLHVSSSDSSSDTSSDSDSSSSSDSSVNKGEKKKGKAKKKRTDNWHRLNLRYPIEFRPDELLNKSFVNSLSVEELTRLCAFYNETDKLKKKVHAETLSKDRKPRKKKFKAKSDDFQKKLHPARFLRAPITSPEKWWGKNVPKKHPEVYRAISLSFLGADRSISQKVIAEAHDRTSVLTIKHFASANVSIQNKPMKEMRRQDNDGASTVTDYCWEVPDNVVKIQDAFYNYCALIHNLWPFDPTGVMMLRLMNKFNWLGHVEYVKTKVDILNGFFNETLLVNAQRAVNEDVIMSFSEQEELLKELMVKNNVRPEVPFLAQQKTFNNHNQNQNQQRQFSQSYTIPKVRQRQGGQQGGQQGGAGAYQAPTRPYANINGVSTCRYYNDRNGGACNNTRAGRDRCKDRTGKEYLHLCNATTASGFCLKPHKNKDHR